MSVTIRPCPCYNPSVRTLIKLSGEALPLTRPAAAARVAQAIAAAHADGQQIAVVVGGGNVWRYRDHADNPLLDRRESDFLGMTATVFSGALLVAALRAAGARAWHGCALPASPSLAAAFSVAGARRALQRSVVVLSGGTGRSGCTTDTAAAQRAAQLRVDRLIKATTVDGVYSADPRTDPRARRYDSLSFADCRRQRLGVLDEAAFAILERARIPLQVCALRQLRRVLTGACVGTAVTVK